MQGFKSLSPKKSEFSHVITTKKNIGNLGSQQVPSAQPHHGMYPKNASSRSAKEPNTSWQLRQRFTLRP